MLAVVALFPASPVQAAGSNVSVSPGTLSVQRGQSFTIQLRGYVSSDFLGANRVAGGLTFPSNLLQVTDVNTSAATLNWQKTHSIGSGVVNFEQRALFPIDNTNVAIGSVTFKTLASGSAVVGYAAGTTFAYNTSVIATARGTGTYTITTPPPATCPAGQTGTPPNCVTPPPATCPAGQTGTPPNCVTPQTPKPTPTQPQTPSTPQTPTPTPTAPSTPTPSPDITEEITGETDADEDGFSISDVTATRGYDSTLLNWKVSEATKATVAYGTSLKDLNKTTDATQKPDGSYEAQLADLTPGKQYYYTISATSETDAAKTDSYSGVFTARGFPVIISVTEDKSPATNAKIKIGEQNYSTDKNGRISLELASGSYTAEIKTPNSSKSFTLAVAKKSLPESGNAPEIQRFIFDIPASTAAAPSSNNLLLLGGGLVAGLLLIGGVLFWLWRRRQSQDQQQPTTMIAADSDYSWAQPQANTNSYAPPASAYPPATDLPMQPQSASIDSQNMYPQEVAPTNAEVYENPYQDPSISPQISNEYAPPPVEEMPPDATIPSEEPVPNYPAPQEDIGAQPADITTEPVTSDAATPYETAPPTTYETAPQASEQLEDLAPAAQVVETPTGSELQINHEARHNSVYIDEEEPRDMFDAANK